MKTRAKKLDMQELNIYMKATQEEMKAAPEEMKTV